MKRLSILLLAVSTLLLLGGCAIEPAYHYTRTTDGGGYYSGQSAYGNADTVIYGNGYANPWTWGGYYGPRWGWSGIGFGATYTYRNHHSYRHRHHRRPAHHQHQQHSRHHASRHQKDRHPTH